MSQIIAAFDPGSTHTAWVMWNGVQIIDHSHADNYVVLDAITSGGFDVCSSASLEMIGHYGTGMPAGKEVFHTCVWIGRFLQAFAEQGIDHRLVLRPTVKTHLCGSARAKDGNVSQALLDRLGPKGTVKNPGPCFGISSHKWAALAVAVYCHDVPAQENEPKL